VAVAEWIVLGSGTLEQQPRRGPSCHLLRDGADTVLVDSGPGCLQRLAERAIDPLTLRAVVHSHLHLDHLADLFPLLFHRLASIAYGGVLVPEPLVLSGAPGHEARLRAVVAALYPKLLGSPLAFQEIADRGQAPLPGTAIVARAFPADHSQSPRLLRFDGPGWSIAYTGDTGPCPALAEAAAGVDWLVAECTSPDAVPRGAHLRPRDLAEVVIAARPRGLALVHLSPKTRPTRSVPTCPTTSRPSWDAATAPASPCRAATPTRWCRAACSRCRRRRG
jgi:ribonuclease BN (tRNA processing enzyme)